jgi:hypothetical protein
MQAVITKAEENEFVIRIKKETEEFGKKVEGVKRRG